MPSGGGEGGSGGTSVPFPITYGPLGLEVAGVGIGLGGGFGLDLGPFGTIGFEGKPRAADTKRAANMLLSSNNPALRKLGFQIANELDRNGVVLSTGDAAARQRLGTYVHEAVTALEAQGISRQMAFNRISNTLSHGTPISFPASSVPDVRRAQNPFPVGGPGKNSLESFIDQLPLYGAGVGAGLALLERQPGNIPLYAFEGYQTGKEVRKLARTLDDFVSRFSRQPVVPPSQSIPPISPQPPSAGSGGPLIVGQNQIPELQSCPECGYLSPQDRQSLEDQKLIVHQELEQEAAQLTKQRIDKRYGDLQRFKDLEQHPADQRDIVTEIQQKQQILQDIENQLGGGQPGGGGQPSPQPPSPGTVPTLDYQPTPIGPQTPQPTFTQGTPPPDGTPHPNNPAAVKFCVQCENQAESLKFLNGEPSACSVIG